MGAWRGPGRSLIVGSAGKHAERYRSGRNGGASKASWRLTPPRGFESHPLRQLDIQRKGNYRDRPGPRMVHLLRLRIGSVGPGEMTEWLKVHAWKACLGETLTWS